MANIKLCSVYILVAVYQGHQSWIGRYQSNRNRPAYGQISTENCLAENPDLPLENQHKTAKTIGQPVCRSSYKHAMPEKILPENGILYLTCVVLPI